MGKKRKGVKELSKEGRKFHSLSARVFCSVLAGSLLLGLLLTMVGLGLYSGAVARQSINTTYGIAESAHGILEKVENPNDLAVDVMERYESLTDAQRSNPDSEEYEALFAEFAEREDYKRICDILSDIHKSTDAFDVYLAMVHPRTHALIYIVDTDFEDMAMPGYWEPNNNDGAEKFLNWDGKDALFYLDDTELYGLMCTGGYPFRTDSEEITCFVMADITMESFISSLRRFVLQYVVILVIVIALFGWLMVRSINRRIIDPINSIAEAAQTYVDNKKTEGQIEGHFSSLNIHTRDEIEHLALAMTEMEHDLVEYEDNLAKIAAERERISTELALAGRIQTDMLPNEFPAFPDRQEFRIYASMTPAKTVGGDFYDFFLVDEDHLALVMADVSGKGIPAAMFMTMSKNMIQNIARGVGGNSPRKILEDVNNLICDNNKEKMFVTVWLGFLEISTGILTAANAGHETPVLKTPEGRFELRKDKHGFVLGGIKGIKYQNYELKLEKGSKLFLYTDGVTEAMNEDEELFGKERTVQALNKAMDQDPEGILRAVSDEVARFAGEAEQFDDLTMLCVEYRGK